MADLENVEDLKRWPWPVLCEKDYFKKVKIKVDRLKKNNIATMGFYGGIFEEAWYLRGMEKLLTDLYFNKKFAEYLLNKVAEISKKAAIKLNEIGFDILYTGDDVATELDLMVSAEMWRKWIKVLFQDLKG